MNTLANRVTFARIMFVPVFVGLLVSTLPYKEWLAAAIFAIIALSDSLDGYLARTFNQVTNLGKILDPLADKIVIIAALIALIQVVDLPVWIAVVLISRELIISGMRFIAIRKDIVMSASLLGKIKTVFQVVAIFFWIFQAGNVLIISYLSWTFILIAILFSLVSATFYIIQFRELWATK